MRGVKACVILRGMTDLSWLHILFFLLGLAATYAAFQGGRVWALKARFIDRPGGRKQHHGAVPPIGGLIVMPIFFALYVLTVPGAMSEWPLFAGLAVLLITGLIDDRHTLRAGLKFLVQIGVALLIVLVGGGNITTFGNLLGGGPIELGWVSVPFSVTCLVMMMNAVNMMDGLDGLAGGVSFVVLVFLTFLFGYAGGPVQAPVSLLIPLSVFLFFNMRHPWRDRAAVFLGDSGSLTLGLVMGYFCIHLSHRAPEVFPPVGAIWLLVVPVIDALSLFFLRLLRGRHPFAPDRNHLHHRFLLKGCSVRATTLWVMGATALAGAVALLPLAGVPEFALFFTWLAGVVLYMGYTLRPSAARTFDD